MPKRQINKQTKQDKSQSDNNIINSLPNNNKIKQEIDYFVAGWGTEADRVMSAETSLKQLMKVVMCLQEMIALKAFSPYRSKKMQSHSRCHWGV